MIYANKYGLNWVRRDLVDQLFKKIQNAPTFLPNIWRHCPEEKTKSLSYDLVTALDFFEPKGINFIPENNCALYTTQKIEFWNQSKM